MNERSYMLDMTPASHTHPYIRVSQHDTDFTLLFTLTTSAGTLEIEPGTTAEIRGTAAGAIPYSAPAALADGIVTVEAAEEMTRNSGTGVFEICLEHGGRFKHSTNFYLIVETCPA